MELWNADAGAAEMSGNGIRCLAQAAVEAGLVDRTAFTVATAAGVRQVEFRPAEAPGAAWASVDMGPVTIGAETAPPPGARRAQLADVGNPHVVLLVDDPAAVDVAARGTAIAATYPEGINVEFVAPRGTGAAASLDFRVWERGAGETLACGTGSVAAAAVAAAWGLVGDRVTVHNPGGPLEVTLGDGAPGDGATTRPARLGGPVRKVAGVEAVVPTAR
jgi:diaminopimelate epimerase